MKPLKHLPGKYSVYVEVTQWERVGRRYVKSSNKPVTYVASGTGKNSVYVTKMDRRGAVRNAFLHARYQYIREHDLPSGATLTFRVIATEVEYVRPKSTTHRVETWTVRGRRRKFNVLRWDKGVPGLSGRIISYSKHRRSDNTESFDRALDVERGEDPTIFMDEEVPVYSREQ